MTYPLRRESLDDVNSHLERKSVTADLNFLVPSHDRPSIKVANVGEGDHERQGMFHELPVQIIDARRHAPSANLDKEGFALVDHFTDFEDFLNAEAVENNYYPQMEELIRSATGARRVKVFDHNVRSDSGSMAADVGLRPPVRNVHNDYTAKSGPQRLKDLMGDEAEALAKGRFAIVNVWRPIVGPVETAPLAVADAGSVRDGDLVATDLVFKDRVGEIYQVAHSQGQRWYSYPGMEKHEALLIKGYDSLEDGTARFAPHTAFDDPRTRPGARPRNSIEVRSLVFY